MQYYSTGVVKMSKDILGDLQPESSEDAPEKNEKEALERGTSTKGDE